MKPIRNFLLGLAALFVIHGAHAQVDAQPMPGDPKLAIFSYDENNSYRVFTRPTAVTHIQLDQDERVKLLTLGDKASWIAQSFENNIFVKPRFPDISTSGTLLTNKRTYQFFFRSSSETGKWYQRISFIDPADILSEVKQENRDDLRRDIQAATPSDTRAESTGSVRVEDLNTDYDIVGTAEFRPTVVQDDGTFTYIQLRPGKDYPAVFRLVGDELELVEFSTTGENLIKVPRVMSAGVLKAGKEEVRFYNRKRMTRSLFGEYREIGSR